MQFRQSLAQSEAGSLSVVAGKLRLVCWRSHACLYSEKHGSDRLDACQWASDRRMCACASNAVAIGQIDRRPYRHSTCQSITDFRNGLESVRGYRVERCKHSKERKITDDWQ